MTRPFVIKYIRSTGCILLFLIGCKESKPQHPAQPTAAIHKAPLEIEVIVQKIIDIPEFDTYLYPTDTTMTQMNLVANAIITTGLNLRKFNKAVYIDSLDYYESKKNDEYYIFNRLQIKKDTVFFELESHSMYMAAIGMLVKENDVWRASNSGFEEIEWHNSQSHRDIKEAPITVPAIAYKGADLGYLSRRYYGNKAYRRILSAYNNFVDKRSVDKLQDSIRIPELLYLPKDPSLAFTKEVARALDDIIKARALFIQHEEILLGLPFTSERRELKIIQPKIKEDLLGASKLVYESIAILKQQENMPKKIIRQFEQVGQHLENIAMGKIDENSYTLDLVHQHLAYGISYAIQWSKSE